MGSVAVIVVLVFVSPVSVQAYTAEVTPWDEEMTAKRAAEAVAQAKARHEEEERKEEERTKAANETNKPKPQEEKSQPELTLSEESEAEAEVPDCVVPSLKGDSLDRARNVLRKHHCQLGKVLKPHGHQHGALVVTGQQTPAGKRLPGGTRIGVRIGPTTTQKHRSVR
jgi:hypothetical protein